MLKYILFRILKIRTDAEMRLTYGIAKLRSIQEDRTPG